MRRPFGSALVDPIAVVATALLLVNDHVLKAHWPGFVTGKLSDVAGMIVAPLVILTLMEALSPRVASAFSREEPSARALRAMPWLVAIVVAAAFAAMKTWAPATAAYEDAASLARVPFRAAIALVQGMPRLEDRIVVTPDATDVWVTPLALVAAYAYQRGAARRSPSAAGHA